jgi:hypothetical protein
MLSALKTGWISGLYSYGLSERDWTSIEAELSEKDPPRNSLPKFIKLIKIDQTAIGVSRHKVALTMDIHYCVLRIFSEPESMRCCLNGRLLSWKSKTFFRIFTGNTTL